METIDPTPDTPARACASCGSAMERHQDWCLECGTAASGRLGGLRPGWRAVSTTLALTLVLVGGAGAASYAALSSDANREAIASVPADGTPVAQAPPVVPAPPAPVVPAPAVKTPTVTTPAAKLPTAPKAAPLPADTSTTAQVTPPASGSSSSSSSKTTTTDSDSETRSSSTAAGDRGAGTNASGTTTTSDADLEPLDLGADAVSVYDPYGRARNAGDPADAYDGDSGTTFEVSAPDDGRELQVGVVIDLEAKKQVRGIEFTTSTPGGRVEVYASDSSALPPDVLDTRWDHPASRASADRKERIVFPKGGAKYRYVTLWFTSPPKSGTTVGLRELDVLG